MGGGEWWRSLTWTRHAGAVDLTEQAGFPWHLPFLDGGGGGGAGGGGAVVVVVDDDGINVVT